MSAPKGLTDRVFASHFVSLPRVVFVCIVALVGLLIDVTVLDLFGIETVTDAAVQFLIMTLGGYLGLTFADMV
ncbi:hypothetical protein [Haladaptatus sp. DJG-WS-42]|uniref:hypothetical protein n=1 Tax=Haladaptatus sp. DJG-WS-42 TaxID=3120516 RepID=UPI0030CDC370